MAKTYKNKQLLVEGNDDLHVMYALCEKYALPKTFDIIDCKGIDKLIPSISTRLKQSGIETIGILVDADSDINARWKEIVQVLIKFGYTTTPANIDKHGLILKESELPNIGIWLMPNNNNNGMLEDFIRFLVPNGDLLLPIAESALNKIETDDLNNYKLIHKSKALIHTWLAWQENPGTPMGLSITKKYLDPSVDECFIFIDWLRKLFQEENK